MYDIIGDIHGYADELVRLLLKLGYSKKNGVFSHPDRKALFVGDFIDRGPKIRETLSLVRRMIDGGHASAVMGNHEYNALCFHTRNKDGRFLREHSPKNIKQHKKTLDAFKDHPSEWEDYLHWFKQLPLFIETDGLRMIHAWWKPVHIQWVRQNLEGHRLTDDFLLQSSMKGSREHELIEDLLKGQEIELPQGFHFLDKGGEPRVHMRTKWWLNFKGRSYREIAMGYNRGERIPEETVQGDVPENEPYPADAPPVFVGHYWLNGVPAIQAPNICCVDYSMGYGEKLCCYRYDNEKVLDSSKLVFVEVNE